MHTLVGVQDTVVGRTMVGSSAVVGVVLRSLDSLVASSLVTDVDPLVREVPEVEHTCLVVLVVEHTYQVVLEVASLVVHQLVAS